jgi:hypothetical protein
MADFSPADIAAALDECAREPVHIPGAIQPFGGLLSFDQAMTRVLQVSANLKDLIGLSVPDALASSPAQLLGAGLLRRIREGLASEECIADALLSSRRLGGVVRRFYVTAYRSGSRVVVELEWLKKDLFQNLLPTVNGWLLQINVPVIKDGNLALSPRRSFDAWQEVVRGYSEPWSNTQQQAAKDLGEDLAMLIFSREVSQLNDSLLEANRQLEELARTDALTGLPNRRVFEDRAGRSIERAQQNNKQFALLFVDLDRFKQINDSLGHQAGDALIRQVGTRLKHAVRDIDTVARLRGDEFAILLDETKSREDALTVKRKVQHA